MQMLKNKRGVAGTTVIVELIIAVFVIGLLIGILAITNASLIASTTNKDAISAINATTQAVKTVPTNNFSLWITVGGLVVVVSLIAIVIVTLRGAGFGMGGGGA